MRRSLVKALLAAFASCLSLVGQAAASVIQTATLLDDHTICSQPHLHCGGTVKQTRPLTGEATVLPVIGTDYGQWLKVRLPGRVVGQPPPPKVGWISVKNVRLAITTWRVVISRAARKLFVFHAGHLVNHFSVVVGKPSTPTPAGRFFIEETLALSPDTLGAPYALALSARSNVLQEFDGGPGQIAIHGVAHIGGKPGTAASHGCVRTTSRESEWLGHHLGAGVPVTVK